MHGAQNLKSISRSLIDIIFEKLHNYDNIWHDRDKYKYYEF